MATIKPDMTENHHPMAVVQDRAEDDVVVRDLEIDDPPPHVGDLMGCDSPEDHRNG